jgi:two-component system chemotaxis response regulator CheY
MRILIVEDDFTSRMLLQKILVPYGECTGVMDGEDAVKSFCAAWEEKRPYTLICMDILMPRMDGKQALQLIREMENRMSLDEKDKAKILMVSSLADQEHVIEAVKSGATWYMVKPISKQKLLDELRRLKLIE